MGSKIVLVDREDIRNVEAEERWEFVFNILRSIGLSEEELEKCYPQSEITVENKIHLRQICKNYQISIVDDLDGKVEIWCKSNDEDVMLARWNPCNFVLKRETSKITKHKEMYVELHLSWWSCFEETNE